VRSEFSLTYRPTPIETIYISLRAEGQVARPIADRGSQLGCINHSAVG